MGFHCIWSKIYKTYGDKSIEIVKENPIDWQMIFGELVLKLLIRLLKN